jgi:hypothetical protein
VRGRILTLVLTWLRCGDVEEMSRGVDVESKKFPRRRSIDGEGTGDRNFSDGNSRFGSSCSVLPAERVRNVEGGFQSADMHETTLKTNQFHVFYRRILGTWRAPRSVLPTQPRFSLWRAPILSSLAQFILSSIKCDVSRASVRAMVGVEGSYTVAISSKAHHNTTRDRERARTFS